MNKVLGALSTEFTSAGVAKSSKVLRAIDGMQRYLSKTRSEAEEVMARDYPSEWDVGIYYG